MRPVDQGGGSGRQVSGDDDKKRQKTDAKTNRKVYRDIDSSNESQSEEHSEKDSTSKVLMKQRKQATEEEVRIAPNSTSHKKDASADPPMSFTGKREAFRKGLASEKKAGQQGPYRRRESDFKSSYPQLTSLQSAQRKKERERRPAGLDPEKLVEKARAAGAHLEVRLEDKKDIKVLVDVLTANRWIRSLKLIGDFGGKSNKPGDLTREKIQSLLVFHDKNFYLPELPDADSFLRILCACKEIEGLDLKGCRLTEKDWLNLAAQLSDRSNLRRLELGGGDYISDLAWEKMAISIASGASSLRELVIDNVSMKSTSFVHLLTAMKDHGKFVRIKLQKISREPMDAPFSDIDSILALCVDNPDLQFLSLANTQFRAGITPFPLFASKQGSETSPDAAKFKNHGGLRVLDLSACGLDDIDMKAIAAACEGHASLIEIRIGGNSISPSDRIVLKDSVERNRKLLEAQAEAAIDLLVRAVENQFDVWPSELIEVLVKNTPAEILPYIAAVINPAVTQWAEGRAPAQSVIRISENSVRGPIGSKASSPQ